MSDEPLSSDVQALWQRQPAEGRTLSVDDLRGRARWLERRIRRRNLREYVAAVVAVIMFGYIAWAAPLLMTRVGAVLAMAAAIFIAYYLYRWGTARMMPADLALTACLQFHCRELEKQRDLLRSVWKWALLPMAPSVILILAGSAWAHPERLVRAGVAAMAVLVVFAALVELNRRVANRIQRKITALEREL